MLHMLQGTLEAGKDTGWGTLLELTPGVLSNGDCSVSIGQDAKCLAQW